MWRERKEIEVGSVYVRPSRHRFYLPPDTFLYTNALSFLTRPAPHSPFRGRQKQSRAYEYIPSSVCLSHHRKPNMRPSLTHVYSLTRPLSPSKHALLPHATKNRTTEQNLSSTKTWRHHSKLCHSASVAVTSPLHTLGHATHDFVVPRTLLC